ASTSLCYDQTLWFSQDLALTTEAGALKENIKKNRYKDILPYDQSRVVLSLLTSDSDSDYINASFIKGASADNRYIASQGPLSSTLTDFWRMIWQHDVKVKHQELVCKKCECYWALVHQSAAFGPFTVHNVRKHLLKEEPPPPPPTPLIPPPLLQDTRSLTQYQFLSWPDHDVPYEAAGVLDLLERARSSQGTHTSPLLIHCSAGCGRTGVICALDYIHDLMVTKQITTDFSIMKIVLELRRQRPSAVQTKVASAAPVYSSVRPRAKPHSLTLSTTPIYDIATSASQRPAEGPLMPHNNGEYHLVPGFNSRIQKPRGPRDPPAEWSRLER
uniref:protein-tyrosine-phosphatase n=1 Tax=Lates calcarifer TaxID=8187 RepID=A0A4W6FTZ4_LATCA